MLLLAAVPPPLRGVVRRLVAYDETSAAPLRRRQAPTPTCTLVLALGEPLRVDGRALDSFLGGLSDAAAVTEFRGHQAGVQVDLAPLGLLRVLGAPGREVTGAPVVVGGTRTTPTTPTSTASSVPSRAAPRRTTSPGGRARASTPRTSCGPEVPDVQDDAPPPPPRWAS